MKKKSMLILIAIMMFIIMPFTVKASTHVDCGYYKPITWTNHFYHIIFELDAIGGELIGKPTITHTWSSKENSNSFETTDRTNELSVELSSSALSNLISNSKCPNYIKVDDTNNKITDYTLARNEYIFDKISLCDKGQYLKTYEQDDKDWQSFPEGAIGRKYYGTVFCDYIHPVTSSLYYDYQLQYKLRYKSDAGEHVYPYWYLINRIRYNELNPSTGREISGEWRDDYNVAEFDSHSLYNNCTDCENKPTSGDYVKCPNMITVDETNKKITSSETDIYRTFNRRIEGDTCLDFISKTDCTTSSKFACVYNETKFGNYCNVDKLLYVACGGAMDIPYQAPEITSLAVTLLKTATPIILILVSLVSLIKALVAAKEDEIKKAQSLLIKRIIIAVVIFFVISIVQFVVNVVAEKSEAGSIDACFKCFLNNKCSSSVYYKTNVGGIHSGAHSVSGTYQCTFFDGTQLRCE